MSEQPGPSSSNSDQSSKQEGETKGSSTQPIPATSSASSYVHEDKPQEKVQSGPAQSSPNTVSLEKLFLTGHNLENMVLAHEIAVDENFKLKPFEPPAHSYQKLVKETMHKAFFDILREELNSDPPEYGQALILLTDVRKGLCSVLLPQHNALRKTIEETLDEEVIKDQIARECLDFHSYANFVIDLMGKLAAPARDEMIRNIKKKTDIVDIYRGILETLEMMKLDLANTLIRMLRPVLQQNIEYERAKFNDVSKNVEDALKHTREWFVRNIDKTNLILPIRDKKTRRQIVLDTVANGFIELLEWDDSKEYPETVQLDKNRLQDIGKQMYRLLIIASVILIAPFRIEDCPSNAPSEYKSALLEKTFILMGDTSNDTELTAILPSIAEEVISMTQLLYAELDRDPLTVEAKELLRSQIMSLYNPNHKVRKVISKRIYDYLKMILVHGPGSAQIPASMTPLSMQLGTLASNLVLCMARNQDVFVDRYEDMVIKELNKK